MHSLAANDMKPPSLHHARPRSFFVTALAWMMMGIGTIVLPISFITVLKFLTHSYGTANAKFMDACIVILGPLLVISVGIGLWRRRQWGLAGTLAMLVMLMVTQGWKLMQGPSPATTDTSYATTSSSGVTTTVIGSGPNYHSLPILLLCTGTLLKLLTRSVRAEFSGPATCMPPPAKTAREANRTPADIGQRDWRVGHRGRDMMYYEEKIDGVWQSIDISGEMLMGRAHHVIYFDSEEQWHSYPAWARHRRSEIISRIMSEFCEPDYEYQGSGSEITPPSTASIAPIFRREKDVVTAKQRAALFAAIIIMLGIAGSMGWLVVSGIKSGETVMPSKRALQQRVLSRQLEPASFWVALGVYALIGVGSGGLAFWGIRNWPKQ